MQLKYLFKHTDYPLNKKIENQNICNLTLDSREIKENSLFIAQQGYHVDSHCYAYDALSKGAYVLMNKTSRFVSDIPKKWLQNTILVDETKDMVSLLAKAYFSDPDKDMTIIGITGTNGKTTTTFMIKSILERAGYKVGLIGTISNMIGEETIPSVNTTPGGYELYDLLNKMKQKKCQFVIMELSSHALELNRCLGLNLSIALMTNITNEHLDFHHTIEEYLESKLKIFNLLENSNNPTKIALYNGNMDYITKISKDLKIRKAIKIYNYGIDYFNLNHFDFNAHIKESNATINQFEVENYGNISDMNISMKGHFSIENALAAFAITNLLAIDTQIIIESLKYIEVKGRFENVTPNHPFTVIVDYAHTPDALENILRAAKNLNPPQLTLIFGAGGNRDSSKRIPMGNIASLYADIIYITSDNPRNEEPIDIINEISEGVSHDYKGIVHKEISRKKAIEKALFDIQINDVIIIAGKGHEEYQVFEKETIYFSDQETVKQFLKQNKRGD